MDAGFVAPADTPDGALSALPLVGAGVVTGAVSAIVVAAASLAVAVYEARTNREYQKVSVWPYVSQSNAWVPGEPYARSVSNLGVGPALVGVEKVDDRMACGLLLAVERDPDVDRERALAGE